MEDGPGDIRMREYVVLESQRKGRATRAQSRFPRFWDTRASSAVGLSSAPMCWSQIVLPSIHSLRRHGTACLHSRRTGSCMRVCMCTRWR